ncbi:MAG: hypothetical protein DRI46_10270 [Chloroflexi bacterium]|nr:MAG: hypothetical protein DRI46_10270 [Chloroflexota bacterium]
MARVTARSNVFDSMSFQPIDINPGSTIDDYYEAVSWPINAKPYATAFLNGLPVKTNDWALPVGQADDLTFVIIPGGGDDGGKQAMALIAMIAVTVLSSGVASGAIGGLGTVNAAGVTVATGLSTAAGAAISIVGALVIGAIFKPSVSANNTMDGASDADDPFGPNPLITGQGNSARIGGVIPKIFGHHKIYPDLAAVPYVIKRGCKQTLYALYCIGYNNVARHGGTERFGSLTLADTEGSVTLGDGSANYSGLHTNRSIGASLTSPTIPMGEEEGEGQVQNNLPR